jgi:hypothetical protein
MEMGAASLGVIEITEYRGGENDTFCVSGRALVASSTMRSDAV